MTAFVLVSCNATAPTSGFTWMRANSLTHAFLSVVSDSLRDKHSTAFEIKVNKSINLALGSSCICTSPLTHASLCSFRAKHMTAFEVVSNHSNTVTL
jgi:hypothetical protein